MPPGKQNNKKAVKPVQPKPYKLPSAVILEIRNAAAIYGAHGRSVQVGAEILKHIPKPLDIPEPKAAAIKRRTYKRSTKMPAES